MLRYERLATTLELSQDFNLRGKSLGCHLIINAVSHKRLETQAYSIKKKRTVSEQKPSENMNF